MTSVSTVTLRMFRRPGWNAAFSVGVLLAAAPAASGAVILAEDFNSTAANPTANPFTTDVSWTYSDSAGTTIDTNESRLFSPGGAGSGTNSVGWISLLNGSNTFQQIATSQAFSSFPALGAGETYQFTLTWFAAADTTTIANDVNAYVSLTSAGNTFAGATGANGALPASNPNGFTSQSLTDATAGADTVRFNFVAEAGSGGINTARTFTASWTSDDVSNGETYSLALGRTTNAAGTPFVIYDNVSLEVTVVPEPATAGLLVIAAGGLLARRRRHV